MTEDEAMKIVSKYPQGDWQAYQAEWFLSGLEQGRKEKDAEIKSQHEIIEEQIKVGQEMAESHNKLMEKIEDLEKALESSRQEIEELKNHLNIKEGLLESSGQEIERLKERFAYSTKEWNEKQDEVMRLYAENLRIKSLEEELQAERQSTRELGTALKLLIGDQEMELGQLSSEEEKAEPYKSFAKNLKKARTALSRHKAGGKSE